MSSKWSDDEKKALKKAWEEKQDSLESARSFDREYAEKVRRSPRAIKDSREALNLVLSKASTKPKWMWSDKAKAELQEAWVNKGLQKALDFDKEFAAKTGRSFSGVKNQRHELQLIETPDTESFEDSVKKARLQIEINSLRRKLTAATVRAAFEDRVIESMSASVYRLPKLTPQIIRPKVAGYKPQSAVLLVSDSHIGEAITSEETGGLVEYGTPIFHTQLAELKKAVIEILYLQGYGVEIRKLYVIFLGDLVTGELIYKGQQAFLDLNLMDQMFTGADAFARMVAEFSSKVPEISCTCLCGNHGRIGSKGETKNFVNWDFIMYKFMERSLEKYDNVHFTIPKAWYENVDIEGHKFLCMHGEDIQRWMGMPFYGVQRAHAKYIQMLKRKKESCDYFVVAHQHEAADLAGSKQLINGAWPGGSMLSAKRLMSISEPTQWFFGVNKKRTTWRYPLNLTA